MNFYYFCQVFVDLELITCLSPIKKVGFGGKLTKAE